VRKPRLLRGPFGDDLVAAVPGWVVARLAVALGMMIAVVAVDELRGGAPRPLQLEQGLFAWDAAWYRDIADHGYDGVAREGLRFFPLLPLLARALSVPLLGNVGLALVIITNVASLATGVLLHRLVREEKGDRALATRAAWLIALLPPAVVLVLGYAEALALALVVGAFLLLRRRQWWAAAGVGILLGLSRPTGMLLALPALIEAFRAWPAARDKVARLAAIAGAPLGTGIYLAWVEWRHGRWDLPLRLQNSADLRAGWDDPLSAIWGSFEALVSGGRIGDGLHVPWIVLFALLLVVTFMKWPASYGAFALVVLGLALSAHNLGSFERYGLFAFPLTIALASITSDPRVERAVLTACGAGLAAFTALIFVGSFVP
jgi:hypothetical protein